MSNGINLEEKMYEMTAAVASLAASVKATSEALEKHEMTCASRYYWQLGIMVTTAGGLITALLTLSYQLINKVL